MCKNRTIAYFMRKLILARNSQMLTDFYRAMLARDMLWQIPLSVRQSV